MFWPGMVRAELPLRQVAQLVQWVLEVSPSSCAIEAG